MPKFSTFMLTKDGSEKNMASKRDEAQLESEELARAEKQMQNRPLAIRWDVRRLIHNIGNRVAVFLGYGHIDARH